MNRDNLREIDRTIVSAVIFSSDHKLLMGKKDPAKGGVYPSAWHIPGGGMEVGETLEEALIREIGQEVEGLNLGHHRFKRLPHVNHGEAAKTLDNGERVWCKMTFNYYEVHLGSTAAELARTLKPGDDLVELRWFSRRELANVEQIPGGKEFFKQVGYL